ncbi:hypothetical protein PSP6_350032 [Paraburkholderia tropica]|nr:hypothetical protein PSP6_350032 [Paraburkholderia tropica]
MPCSLTMRAITSGSLPRSNGNSKVTRSAGRRSSASSNSISRVTSSQAGWPVSAARSAGLANAFTSAAACEGGASVAAANVVVAFASPAPPGASAGSPSCATMRGKVSYAHNMPSRSSSGKRAKYTSKGPAVAPCAAWLSVACAPDGPLESVLSPAPGACWSAVLKLMGPPRDATFFVAPVWSLFVRLLLARLRSAMRRRGAFPFLPLLLFTAFDCALILTLSYPQGFYPGRQVRRMKRTLNSRKYSPCYAFGGTRASPRAGGAGGDYSGFRTIDA